MTERLEPAPLFGDGNDYGGPIKQSDLDDEEEEDNNSEDSHNPRLNNDNAGSDIEIEIKDSDDDDDDDDALSNSDAMTLNAEAATPEIKPIQSKQGDSPRNMKSSIALISNSNDMKEEEEEEDPGVASSPSLRSARSGSDNSNKELMTHYKKASAAASIQLSEQRATSAGISFGEREDQERVDTDSDIFKIEVKENGGSPKKGNGNDVQKKEYRLGHRKCCGDCYSRLYSYPRIRIFLSFLYLLISMILVCGDIFAALWIGNEIWTFKYPNANTDYHELWFGILMVLVSAPFLILWAAHLIFIEETISKQNERRKCLKWMVLYPFMLLYVITPIGIAFLLIFEFLYIYLWKMFELFMYRFLCRKPSYKMIMNIKKTKGSRAYLRFRKITHMVSSSLPLMVYYGYLWYFDPYPRLKWKYLAPAAFISGLNSIFTILSFLQDAKSMNVPMTQYFMLSLRLFGGFIPKLSQIKNGKIRRINYSSFAFGNYTYAKFADVIEYDTSKLDTVILTTSTLSDLSNSLCFQLGAVCAAKDINIIILKNYSPYVVWFKHLFPKKFPYKVTLTELKQAFRNCDIFGDKAEEEFDELESNLDKLYGKDNNDKYYYYKDFVDDWNGFQDENEYNRNANGDDLNYRNMNNNGITLGMFHRLLRILPPHIVDINNKHTNKNRKRDERLLNLVLGCGKINDIDPTNKTSALFYAIIQMDYDLINRLCDNGAKTSKDEWQKMGEYIIRLVKDNNINALQSLIQLIKDRNEIECDLTYHDIDGKTAIMYAAMNGNQPICEILLNCGLGADILHVDQDGNTAADLANVHKHQHVEDYLRNQFL